MCNDRYPRVTAFIDGKIVGEDDAGYRKELVERLEAEYPDSEIVWEWRLRPGEKRPVTREELLVA